MLKRKKDISTAVKSEAPGLAIAGTIARKHWLNSKRISHKYSTEATTKAI